MLRAHLHLLVPTIMLVTACRSSRSDGEWPDARQLIALDSVVNWGGRITLEENDDVINVAPEVEFDPAGGFLVADTREAQLRRYDESGKLLSSFGRRGDGPGEFQQPRALVRVRDGLIGIGWSGRMAIFDSTGSDLRRTVRGSFLRVDQVVPVDDSLLLIAGALPSDQAESSWLHLWHLERDSVIQSFFRPLSVEAGLSGIARSTGWANTSQRRDTIAATFSIIDTLYFLDLDGAPVGQVPIPFSEFRPVTAPPNRIATREWQSSFDLIASVDWVAGGELLVQWWVRSLDSVQWNLLLMTPQGELRFDLRDTPRLLATDQSGSRLLFVTPGSVTPNDWSMATLKYGKSQQEES